MTDATPGADDASQPTVEQSALAARAADPFASNGAPPVAAPERPELTVAAAFAGGLALALLLKRLAR
jgi:hypothetical protein